MGIAHEVPRDGIFLTAEQWEQIQLSLMAIKNIELAICQKSLTVDVAEAAVMLGLHPVTVRQKARNGEMPKTCSKPNEQRKWNRKDIEKMAESRKFGGRPRNV